MVKIGDKGKGSDFPIVFLFALLWGVVILDRSVVTYVFADEGFLQSTGFTNIHLGMITSATSIGFALSSIFVSMTSDRLGRKKWFLIVFALIAGIFSGSMALTTVFVAIIIIRLLTGVGEGPIFPLMSVILAKQTNPKRFANYQGAIQIAVAIASGIVGPMLTVSLVQNISWNMTYLATAIPAIILALILIPVIKEKKEETLDSVTAVKSDNGTMAIKDFLPVVLKNRNVLICMIANVLYNGIFWTFISYGPKFWVFDAVDNVTYESVGMILAAMGLLGIMWCIVLPIIANKVGRRPVTIASAFAGGITLIAVGASGGAFFSMVLYCLFLGGMTFLTMLFVAIIPIETLPKKMAATASAFIMGVGELIGGVIVPPILGGVADSFGLSKAFLIVGILSIVMGAICFFLNETLQKKTELGAKEANA